MVERPGPLHVHVPSLISDYCAAYGRTICIIYYLLKNNFYYIYVMDRKHEEHSSVRQCPGLPLSSVIKVGLSQSGYVSKNKLRLRVLWLCLEHHELVVWITTPFYHLHHHFDRFLALPDLAIWDAVEFVRNMYMYMYRAGRHRILAPCDDCVAQVFPARACGLLRITIASNAGIDTTLELKLFAGPFSTTTLALKVERDL
jgi:hypothetical protein